MMIAAAGCTMPPEAGAEPIRERGTGARCDAKPAQKLVGKAVSKAVIADAKRLSGAATVRTIEPDGLVTMDYREDRLNIHHDAARRIVRIACG